MEITTDWVANYRPWRDKQHLWECYVNRGMTIQEIADAMNTSYPTVHTWLDKFGIERRESGEYQTPELLKNADWLQTQYWGKKRSMGEIAAEVGCSRNAVSNALDRHGIEKRENINPQARKVLSDAETLRELYVEEHKSQSDIADELGCSQTTVGEWLHRHNIETRDLSDYTGEHANRWNGGYESKYTAEWIEARQECLERDNHKCQRCGMEQESHLEEYGRSLDVHHITPLVEYDDNSEAHQLENLVALCRECHNEIEGLPIDNGV